MINQHKAHVEHYVKQAEYQWLFTEYSGRDAKVGLTTIALELALADLYENYENVEF